MSNVQAFSFAPTNLQEAMHYAKLISTSTFIPTQFRDKPADILVAVQWGAELGLPPLQALQNIAVINGRPTLWGDAALAVAQQHPAYEWISEKIEEDDKGNMTAICILKRKGHEAHRAEFSLEMAKRAGLLGKQGPWTQYPKRMLQMRARGFALRDVFADALRGLITREEAMDFKVVDAEVVKDSIAPQPKEEQKLVQQTAEAVLDKVDTKSKAQRIAERGAV